MGTSAADGSFTVAVALRSPFDEAAEPRRAAAERVAACVAQGLARRFFLADRRPIAGEPAGEELARLVLDGGGEPVVAVAAGAAGRDELLARARGLAEAGVGELLVVTGDHAGGGGAGRPFDVDAAQLLMLLAAREGGAGGLRAGCVVSPNKTLEAELRWQYERLRRKVALGAAFVVAQVGYDPRAWDELARFRRLEGLPVALLGTVLLPDDSLAARIRAGRVPGVAVPPSLLERLSGDDPRPGLRLAGEAVAALRGLGYEGVLLCGRRIGPAEVAAVLEEADRIGPRWRERLEALRPALPRASLYREEPATGLATDEPSAVAPRRRHHPMYLFSYFVDYVAFGSWEPFFRVLTAVCRFCDPRPFWRRALWWVEYVSKAPIYRCRMCGDCTLYACGFLCTESACPKRMVNGPCGGSRDGRCEVEGAGRCVWVTVYERLKANEERPGFPAPPVPPKDRSLEGTCSWINFCLGRDHRKGRVKAGAPPRRPGSP